MRKRNSQKEKWVKLILIGAGCLFFFGFSLEGKERVFQGEVFMVKITQAHGLLLPAYVQEVSSAQRIAQYQSWPLPHNRFHYLFIPISHLLRPGSYELVVGEGREQKNFFFEVLKGEFLSEDIVLQKSLRTVVYADDETKNVQKDILKETFASREGVFYESQKMIMPLEKFRYTSYYADHRKYILGESSWMGYHMGIDLVPIGNQIIRAMGSGRVVIAREFIIQGKTVVIEHLPGVFSVYMHAKELYVQEGDLVLRGNEIAHVGSTGLSQAPHLHFEVIVEGVSVSPEKFIEHFSAWISENDS